MDITGILTELQLQRDKIQQAINTLTRIGGKTDKRRGPKPGRHLSPEARRRISLAMKKRWAERKKAA
jgi:hypothetical protein